MSFQKYDEDEVMIFAGRFADQFTAVFFSKMQAEHADEVRNSVANAAEDVMRSYPGDAAVPLPKDLLAGMKSVADTVATARLTAILNEDGGEGF